MIQQSSGEPPGPFAIDLDADAIFGACAPADAFAAVLMEARVVLADIASPLHAELWGSDILAALGGSTAAADLVPAAEAAGTPAALALLRALSAVGSPGLRADADAAAARLAAHGVAEPSWAESVGAPAVGECWYYGDERRAQEVVTTSFAYARARHVVSVLVDHHRGGGRIKDVWVGDAENVLARARAMSQLDPKIAFEMIGPADARARLERAIIAGECPQQPEETANVASARAILRARVAHLPRH
jgi:hypothetical protein